MINWRAVNILDFFQEKNILAANRDNKNISDIGIKEIIDSFSCPKNPDVEHFLKHDAVDFAKRGIGMTFLVLDCDDKLSHLLGFFTIANKIVEIRKKIPDKNGAGTLRLSNTREKVISRFGTYVEATGTYSMATLIIMASLQKTMPCRTKSRLNSEAHS